MRGGGTHRKEIQSGWKVDEMFESEGSSAVLAEG